MEAIVVFVVVVVLRLCAAIFLWCGRCKHICLSYGHMVSSIVVIVIAEHKLCRHLAEVRTASDVDYVSLGSGQRHITYTRRAHA